MNSDRTATPVVTVIGAMGLDVLASTGAQPDADDSTPGAIQFVVGGVGRNIAEGLSRLSIDCRLHSMIGDDLAGDQVASLTHAAGVVTDRIIRDKRAPTPVYVAVNDDSGLLHAVSDMALIEHCHPEQFPDLPSDIENSDLCVIDANLPEAAIQSIVHSRGKTSVVAEGVSVTKCQRLSSVLSELELLKVNQKEAAKLADISHTLPPAELASVLLDLGVGSILMTLGAQGVLYASSANGARVVQECPSFATTIHSVNGAGDSLLAGFLAARLYGESVETQLVWGSEAARLSLMTSGACSDLLTIKQLRQTAQ